MRGQKITIIGVRGDLWSINNVLVNDIVLVYVRDRKFIPTEVGM